MIVKGVSDGRFMWRDGEPLTYEEADIYREARGSAGARERGGKKEEEVENMCGKAKAARAVQSQKMTHDISNSICSI